MKTTIIVTSIAAALVPPAAQAQLVVAAPGVEVRQDAKNIFDQIKYAWEQTQWADKLATLHSTLTAVRQHLETANLVKQAIGDPVAAIALIDNGLFSEYLQDSGIGETLGELIDITRRASSFPEVQRCSPSNVGLEKSLGRYRPVRGIRRSGSAPLRSRGGKSYSALKSSSDGRRTNGGFYQQIARLNQLKSKTRETELVLQPRPHPSYSHRARRNSTLRTPEGSRRTPPPPAPLPPP